MYSTQQLLQVSTTTDAADSGASQCTNAVGEAEHVKREKLCFVMDWELADPAPEEQSAVDSGFPVEIA